jgi:phospholipase C
VTDIRDPQAAERLPSDELLRRRDFLQRTASLAGIAGGAALLGPDTLVAEAARRQRRKHLPSPRNLPIDTFVVLMMENRSFDHYLGWMPEADGLQEGLEYAGSDGRSHPTHRLTPEWQGCDFKDPDHSWTGGRVQLNGGTCDGWLHEGSDNDDFALGYYAEGDLGFIQDAAKQSTTFDRFHCSIMASTFPNREYMHSGQSYGQVDNYIPIQERGFPFDTTIWAALDRAGVSNRYFYSDVPVLALWGQDGVAHSSLVQDYYQRAASGTLPNVSFVDPNFGQVVGEGGGTSGDEHPHGDVRTGQAFMADVCHAFMESPQWERGALFIVYDEWGGFYDHVRPKRVPDIRNNADINQDYGLMGFRIPVVALSPYLRRGHVDHTLHGFESILKMIEYRFSLKPLTRRDAYANNIARSFDWVRKPRLTPPELPTPEDVVSQACAAPRGEGQARPKEHDLVALESSGYLDRLGFEVPRGASSFRMPDTIRRGLAS